MEKVPDGLPICFFVTVFVEHKVLTHSSSDVCEVLNLHARLSSYNASVKRGRSQLCVSNVYHLGMCVLMQCKNANPCFMSPRTTSGQAAFGLMRQSQSESEHFRCNAESGNLAQGIANVSNAFYSQVPMIPDMSVSHSLAQAT